MDELRKALSRFRLRLMVRQAGYAALSGLVIALVIVVAAPWLREAAGLPGYYATMALPLALPAVYVLIGLWWRPDDKSIAMAADAWSGAGGSIVSAVELARENPNSPFVEPVAARAAAALKAPRLPEPRLLRRLLTAFAVLFLMLPLSRWVHAQMAESEQEEKAQQEARKTEPPADAAEKLAQEAGKAAQEAEELGATQAKQLAEDLEEAARKAQAGPQDKERALREANSLADRANAQRQAQESRADARDAMARNDLTRELAEALDKVDNREVDRAVKDIAAQIHNPDGSFDKERAASLLKSLEEAAAKAPQDARLRRAADELRKQLADAGSGKRKELQDVAAKDTATEADKQAAKAALEELAKLDRETLERAMQEFAEAASKLRDIDPSGKKSDELADEMRKGQLTPEQAAEMAKTAAELAKRLELDAETLRELLKQGKDFEGMEELAKEMLEQQARENPEFSPDEIPEWAREFAEEAMKQQWAEQAKREAEKRNGERTGNGEGTGEPGEGKGEGGEGEGTGKNGESNPTGEPTREVGGEGKEEGIDSKDTGKGEKDPDKDPNRLDPKKAAEEKAARESTGRESGSHGLNTREEEETLPRRYRDAARKYFER